jgi:hypothetical protein
VVIAVPSVRGFFLLGLVSVLAPKHFAENTTKPTLALLLLRRFGRTIRRRTKCIPRGRSRLNDTFTCHFSHLPWPGRRSGLASLQHLLYLLIDWVRCKRSSVYWHTWWCMSRLRWCLRSNIGLAILILGVARAQRTRLRKFLLLILVERRVLHNGNWSADFQVSFPDSLGLPARALQTVRAIHVCGHETLPCEHMARTCCFKQSRWPQWRTLSAGKMQ